MSGAIQESVDLHARALAIDEKHYGPDHANVAIDLESLGTALAQQNHMAESEKALRRAISILERITPGHAQLGVAYDALASFLVEEDRLAEAHEAAARARDILERALGPDHPTVSDALVELGKVLSAEGKPSEALPLLQRAVDMRIAGLGPEHLSVARALLELGGAQERAGQAQAGLASAERALAIYVARVPGSQSVAESQFLTARLLWTTNGDHGRAVTLARAARKQFVDVETWGPKPLAELDAWMRARKLTL
jgi:tetratricopeptide (TPR) repeat protein